MKRLTAFLLSLLMVLSLAACGEDTHPDTGGDSITPQHGLKPKPESDSSTAPQPTEPDKVELKGDTYWVAYQSEGDEREYVPEGDDLLTDLTLWADGTARIREIEDGIWLSSEIDEQNMTWKQEADGTLHLYTAYSGDEPYHSGAVAKDGTLELKRFGGTYYFKQETMPEGGALYSPAELQGVWMVSQLGVDGYEEDLSGSFNTLVFETDWSDEDKTLVASSEHGGEGYLIQEDEFSAYQERGITLLDEAIYSGCGNEVWSVRIGEESPLNANGYPENTEHYATLLDQNTLLLQNYFSIDGGPGVSYQTYKRFLPRVCYDLEGFDLVDCCFELAGYITSDGTKTSAPPGMSNFTLYLTNDTYLFNVDFDDGSVYNGGGGYWEMGRGGTLHMTSEGSEEDWLAGAAQSFNEIPEVYLWYEGGILWLQYIGGSEALDQDSDYVDTMDDIEGIAFSAPENALFVLFNQSYGDLANLQAFPIYEIDDGPQAQYVLVTSVIDENYFWLDEDGFCREDFGTVHAGESFVIKVNIPESGGYLLQIESSVGNYYFELTQSTLAFDGWNYITT